MVIQSVFENPQNQQCHRTRPTVLTMTERQSEPMQSFKQVTYHGGAFITVLLQVEILAYFNIILCGVTVAVHLHDITDKEV